MQQENREREKRKRSTRGHGGIYTPDEREREREREEISSPLCQRILAMFQMCVHHSWTRLL